MSKLPRDVGLAFERARALYTPSPERLAEIEVRIALAIQAGASAGVDVPQALFVPSSRAWRRHRWGLPYWMALGALVVALGLKSAAGLWDAAAPVQPARAVAALPASPKIESAAALQTPVESFPDVPLVRDAARLPATARERAAAPASKPRLADKPRRVLAGGPKPGQTAISTPPADPFGAAFDLPVPTLPAAAREPEQTLHGGAAGSDSARTKVNTVSSKAQSTGLLAAEVRLISQAQKAIGNRELARAWVLLGQHRRDFPAGQLLAERVALEVLTQCRAGDAAGAEQALRELALLAPDSQLLRSAKQKCGEWSGR